MKLSQNFVLFLLLVSLFSYSSCGGDDELSVDEYILQSNMSFQESSSGLFYNISTPGVSPQAGTTSFVVFDLRGQLLDGSAVGNTFEAEADFRIDLNQDIIPGLKESLQFLGTGGRGTFILPPDLAFGATGNGVVPANAHIIYEIEVKGIYENDMAFSDELLSNYIAVEGLESLTKTESGLYILIDEPGNDTMPNSTQNVTVHYEGYFLNGDVFDSSIARGTPSSFGLNQVISGWTEGIPYFGEGGKGKLLIPSHLAYGSEGNQTIPGYTPILFDIELISVN